MKNLEIDPLLVPINQLGLELIWKQTEWSTLAIMVQNTPRLIIDTAIGISKKD